MCDFAYVCARVCKCVCVCDYVCALASVWRYVFTTSPAFAAAAAGRKYLLNEVAFVSVV